MVRLYKNNTDFEGHSYGCHENYLIGRETPFQQVIDGLLPFVVTRPIFAGAGKVGVENASGGVLPPYQLSQRADFFETIASVDTMHRRPLVNTRDEPHADRNRFRRLHMITGDANMSEYITALKVGTMGLVLELLESGRLPSYDSGGSDRGAQGDLPRPLEGLAGAACRPLFHHRPGDSADLPSKRRVPASPAGTRRPIGSWLNGGQVLDDLGTDPALLIGPL